MFKILNSLKNNSQKYSFHIKILTNNLPTMQNLNIRYPYLYTTSNCIQCLNTENTKHILLFKKNNSNIYQSLINIIKEFKSRPGREFLYCNSIFNKSLNFHWYKVVILVKVYRVVKEQS